MSRRAATFTQAEVARAMRAAEQIAPGRWRVRVRGGEVIIEPAPPPAPGDDPPTEGPSAPQVALLREPRL